LLVSDGRISNNFPIQFFDSPLPSFERVVFEETQNRDALAFIKPYRGLGRKTYRNFFV